MKNTRYAILSLGGAAENAYVVGFGDSCRIVNRYSKQKMAV